MLLRLSSKVARSSWNAALHEAVCVLRPGGCLAVFDGDYATGTLATGAGDPMDACAEAFRTHFIHDPWLVRRLSRLVQAAAPPRHGGHSDQ
jgi:hypothetical protein